MQLFYTPDIQSEDKEFTFSKEESKHITKVLRKKSGDHIHITNGKGHLFEAEITMADQKNCLISILKCVKKERHPYRLHIAIAPTKMNDRLEWFLEKATEIGIDEITPVICDNSERKIVKQERLEKIIQSAMKQSLQTHLPKLNDAIKLQEFINQPLDGQRFIAHCYEDQKQELNDQLLINTQYTILIGPEGDFSKKEIETALSNQFIPVSLGNTRLRTETAGIVACHTVALKNL